MSHLFISAALLLAVLLAFTSAETYYVTPTASTPCPEEDVPCFTLPQYATKPNNYFTFNTTLILLPGSHSLDSELKIDGIDTLTIARNTTTYSDTSIICSQSTRFILKDIGVVSMRGLVLIGCMNNSITSVEQFALEDCSLQGQGHNGTGMELHKVTSANIVRSSFSSYTGKEIHNRERWTWDPDWEVSVRAGGAIITESSTITIYRSSFTNNTVNGDSGRGGAVFAEYSNVTMNSTIFNNITVNGDSGRGGAVCAWSSNVTMNNNTLNNNVVNGVFGYGGAVNAWSSTVTMDSNTFTSNTVNGDYGAGGAVYAVLGTVIMNSNTFNNNSVTGDYGQGGAVYDLSSNVTTNGNTFNNNTVNGRFADGGAAYIGWSSKVIMNSNTFNNNTVTGYYAAGGAVYARAGGAVYARSSIVTLNSNKFHNNTANGDYGAGGAVHTMLINVTMYSNTFNNNIVTGEPGDGGAVCAKSSNVTMDSNTFNNNSATHYGGALYINTVTLYSTGFLDIQNNTAAIGGALYASQSTLSFSGNTTISNNCGSLHVYACNVTFMGHTNIMNNSYSANTSQEGGAVNAIQSEIVFTGTVNLNYNTAIHGGGISATQSKLYVYGDVTIAYNSASLSGGGIYAYQSELNLENHVTINISNNSAGERGGGIHVVSLITRMKAYSKTYFVGNHAERGGGACLEMNAKFYIIKKVIEDEWDDEPDKLIRLEFTGNSANYGGALYITDDTNSGTCHATPFSGESTISNECFIQGLTQDTYNNHHLFETIDRNIRNTYFTNNWASECGHEIYGGLLDRCTVNPYAEILYKLKDPYSNNLVFAQSSLSAVSYILHITNLNIQDFNDSTKMISSDPVRVCFCRDNQLDCSYHPQPVYARKGETFTVSLAAVDQVNNTISNTIIHALSQGKLGEGQSAQRTNKNGTCTRLNYAIFSSHNSELLSLYAEGPCMGTGISTANLALYIEPCPVGFKDIDQRCDCNRILLNKYISKCSIDDQTVLRKDNVWFSYVNTTDHPHNYIFHKHCPFDYCRPPTVSVHVNLTIPNGADAMCAFNRSGKLCGSCKDGLSLFLGSSHCMQCSNNWLALLFVFAIAGVVLVTFLLVCNLTVAVGTINGLIFYANIIVANRAIFLPFDKPNVLTIFLSWVNLDFGFETCFYNGMDGYAKTWLQLAFPLYIISLVVAIIVISDHSSKFAVLFTKGKDPIATLATLILLSYTKLIRTIIAALSFTTLEYSDGSHELVWLTDANVPYLIGKHIPLFITVLVIVIIAMAYTLFLFCWQWINMLCPNIWITKNAKLNIFMDTYHTPYNKDHRYWIGMLLLVRVLLYLISSLNVLGDPHINILSSNSAVVILFFFQGVLPHKISKIHKKYILHIIENASMLNLIGFASVTFYITADLEGDERNLSQAVVAYISISIAFIIFLAILIYHTWEFVLKRPFQLIKSRFINPVRLPIQQEDVDAPSYDIYELDYDLVSVTEFDGLPDPVDTGEDDFQIVTDEDELSSKVHDTEPDNKDTSHNNTSRNCPLATKAAENNVSKDCKKISVKHIDNEIPLLSCVIDPELTRNSGLSPVIQCHGNNDEDGDDVTIWGDESTSLLAQDQ